MQNQTIERKWRNIWEKRVAHRKPTAKNTFIEGLEELKEVVENPQPLFDHLTYSSYCANRGYGMTHEQLVRIGVGTEEMRERYENDQEGNYQEMMSHRLNEEEEPFFHTLQPE